MRLYSTHQTKHSPEYIKALHESYEAWENEIATMDPELKAKAEAEFEAHRKASPSFDKMVREW